MGMGMGMGMRMGREMGMGDDKQGKGEETPGGVSNNTKKTPYPAINAAADGM